MTDRELMQQALKALDWISRAKAMDYEYRIKANEVLPALRARLAQSSEMDEAIAAGDGTLHGAIDYWQERALKAEARLAQKDEPSAERLHEMTALKNAAYAERNKVVAGFAALAMKIGYAACRTRTEIEGWSDDWHGCVYIQLPTGQVSWHYHDSEAELFSFLPENAVTWDGHDTDEKYRRVLALRYPTTSDPRVMGEPSADFEKGDTRQPDDVDHTWAAGIHAPRWGNQVECYGNTKQDAETLRDRVLAALNRPEPSAEPVYCSCGDEIVQDDDPKCGTCASQLQKPEQAGPVDLQDIEQYRMQMAGICTAALGYWKEGDSVHPDYDTPALREVAELYAKYAKLAAQPKRTPLTDEKINDEMDRLLLSPVEQEAFGAGVRYAERKHGIKG